MPGIINGLFGGDGMPVDPGGLADVIGSGRMSPGQEFMQWQQSQAPVMLDRQPSQPSGGYSGPHASMSPDEFMASADRMRSQMPPTPEEIEAMMRQQEELEALYRQYQPHSRPGAWYGM